MGKQSQLLLQPTEVELGLQVGVKFDKRKGVMNIIGIFKNKKEVLQVLKLFGSTLTLTLTNCSGPRGAFAPKNLWLYLASWNLPDSQLCLESKIEPGVAKGGNRTENRHTGRGGHHTYLIEVGTLYTLLGWGHPTCLIAVGTLHIAYWGGDTAQH